jgi:hypothetical protein
MGERSRDRALDQFSADRILPRYEALYRRVIAGRGLIPMLPCHRGNLCRADSTCPLFAIGNRKSKIAVVAVPVVQRIEQGFPKP